MWKHMKRETANHDLEQWVTLVDTKAKVHCLFTSDCPLGCRIIVNNYLPGTSKDGVSDQLRKMHPNTTTKTLPLSAYCNKTLLFDSCTGSIFFFVSW